MTRKSKKKASRKIHSAVQPAPMLFSRSISLTDVFRVSGSLANFTQVFQAGANGYKSTPTATTFVVPQQAIWTQYAAMFEFYQVTRVHVRFIPYRWNLSQLTTGSAASITGYPTYSIVDPEQVNPNTVPNFAAYGNMHVTCPYEQHQRHMSNYTDLGLSKQTLIQLTNGTAAARALYDDATNMAFLVESPNKTSGANEIGVAIVTMNYVFSGQKNPLVPALKCLSVEESEEKLTERNEQKSKLLSQLAQLEQ